MYLRIKLIQGIGMLLKQGIFQLVGVMSTVDLLVSQSSLPSYLQDMRARCHVGVSSNTHAAKMASKVAFWLTYLAIDDATFREGFLPQTTPG